MWRVLIVDDEPEVVDGLVDILSELEGVELFTAYLADEALALLERQTVDVVLADIHMPGMDGLEMCELIQARWPERRIIFLSGVRDFDAIYRSIQNPSVRYLTKMESDLKIQQTVSQVFREIEGRRAEQLMHQALEEALPLLKGQSIARLLEAELSRDPNSQDALVRMRNYIQNNLDKDLSLSALGHQAHFHPNYLSRLFKEEMGIALSDYILQLRMSTARELLLTTSERVHNVALRVGYDSVHSFIRAFRKTYGTTPAECRQRAGAANDR